MGWFCLIWVCGAVGLFGSGCAVRVIEVVWLACMVRLVRLVRVVRVVRVVRLVVVGW